MIQRTEIPLHKPKLALLFIGALLFVIGGFKLAINPLYFSSARYNNETFMRIIGIISVLFFFVCMINIFRKLIDRSVGLIIDEKGIYDNSNTISTGLTVWQEITEITEYTVHKQRFIIIKILNPQLFIDKISNKVHKKHAEMNYKHTGSPIIINTNGLKISFIKLWQLIIESYNTSKIQNMKEHHTL